MTQPSKDVIARIIDPRPFERALPLSRDIDRRTQALRKAAQILAHLIDTSEAAEALAAKTPKDEGDE